MKSNQMNPVPETVKGAGGKIKPDFFFRGKRGNPDAASVFLILFCLAAGYAVCFNICRTIVIYSEASAAKAAGIKASDRKAAEAEA